MIGVKSVNDDHEVMLITDKGIIIQIRANDVSNIGRITMGVKIMNLDDNSRIVKIAKVRDKIEGGDEIENISEEISEDKGSGDTENEEGEGEGEDA